jgi:hypothetical protein
LEAACQRFQDPILSYGVLLPILPQSFLPKSPALSVQIDTDLMLPQATCASAIEQR